MSEQRVLRKIAFSWGVILINGIQNTEKSKASCSVLRNHKVLASLYHLRINNTCSLPRICKHSYLDGVSAPQEKTSYRRSSTGY